MLILINLTGLNKFYFLPFFKVHKAEVEGWWCLDIKWTIIQLNLFNKAAGQDMIKFMSNNYKEQRKLNESR
jgi:hypothetical protein